MRESSPIVTNHIKQTILFSLFFLLNFKKYTQVLKLSTKKLAKTGVRVPFQTLQGDVN